MVQVTGPASESGIVYLVQHLWAFRHLQGNRLKFLSSIPKVVADEFLYSIMSRINADSIEGCYNLV